MGKVRKRSFVILRRTVKNRSKFFRNPLLWTGFIFIFTAKGHLEIIDTEYSVRTALAVIEEGSMLIEAVDPAVLENAPKVRRYRQDLFSVWRWTSSYFSTHGSCRESDGFIDSNRPTNPNRLLAFFLQRPLCHPRALVLSIDPASTSGNTSKSRFSGSSASNNNGILEIYHNRLF